MLTKVLSVLHRKDGSTNTVDETAGGTSLVFYDIASATIDGTEVQARFRKAELNRKDNTMTIHYYETAEK